MLLAALAFESLAFAHWAYFPYGSDNLRAFSETETIVFQALAPLSPLFLMGLLYGRFLKTGFRGFIRRSRTFGPALSSLTRPLASLFGAFRPSVSAEPVQTIRVLQHPRLMLALAVLVSAMIAFAPYRPDINPQADLVGVDAPLYQNWLSEMISRPFADAMAYAFGPGASGSRPLLLAPLYLVSTIGGFSAPSMVRALPVILGPLLCLSTFAFVRFGQGNERLAGLATMLTAVSYDFTVGMWGGYYANWLALSEVYVFLTVLLLFSRSFSVPKFLALMVLSLTILLTHPWTWVLIMTVGLVFAVSFVRETKQLSLVWFTITLVSTGVMVDFFKNMTFGARTVAEDIVTKTPIAGLHELAMFWPNVINSLLYTHGGLMANAVFLGLAIIPVMTLRLKDGFQRLLILWVLVAAAPLAFFDSYHQARILYDLPIPVLEAIGTLQLLRGGRRSLRWPGLVVLLLTLFGANYALRAMFEL